MLNPFVFQPQHRRVRSPMPAFAESGKMRVALERDAKKWAPVFRKKSRVNRVS